MQPLQSDSSFFLSFSSKPSLIEFRNPSGMFSKCIYSAFVIFTRIHVFFLCCICCLVQTCPCLSVLKNINHILKNPPQHKTHYQEIVVQFIADTLSLCVPALPVLLLTHASDIFRCVYVFYVDLYIYISVCLWASCSANSNDFFSEHSTSC